MVKSPLRWTLAWAEPFRIFFPLGLFLGAVGVSLWPLFFWGLVDAYPAAPHMRLMIEGLMGSFVIGFLGTAGPRLFEAPPFRPIEGLTLFVLQATSGLLHLVHRPLAGDLLFLALLLFFLGALARRVKRRGDLPPPSFLLVLGGFLNAVAGIALLQCDRLWIHQLGNILLNEGFVLFPLLGVGAFFFPLLLDTKTPAQPSDLRVAAGACRRGALIALLCALALWLSFLLEAMGWTRSAALGRGLTIAWFLLSQGGLFRKSAERTFLAHCFQAGSILLIAGLFLPVVFPDDRVANLHVVFLGGYSVLLFTVSTRVILGHSGESHLFQRRLRWLVATLSLLILAMLTRVSADVFPAERNSHLVYAALLWLVAAAIWLFALGSRLGRSEE